MPINIQNLDDFKNKLEKAGDQLVVVDFWADWCGPCKIIAPKFEEFSKEFGEVIFLKVNTDEQEEISAEQKITSLPTFRFFKSGKPIIGGDVIGASPENLREKLLKYSSVELPAAKSQLCIFFGLFATFKTPFLLQKKCKIAESQDRKSM
ncbi:365_t:CDS:2 [Scutellospora calospora]|uniref:365_t:CDS:1 n=1 Tax=Scutellospora calospora TaxID=85575 RepID=A0ACA9JUS6_9GLOM|nr:365_t:CDS:2 [Scutellospora calospora]